jgi:hypothetical protein
MKYATEIGSDAMMYRPSFLKICSAIHKMMGGWGDRQRAYRSHKPIFFLKEEGKWAKTINNGPIGIWTL